MQQNYSLFGKQTYLKVSSKMSLYFVDMEGSFGGVFWFVAYNKGRYIYYIF